MPLEGRIRGLVDSSGDYVVMQGDRELKRIPSSEVQGNRKLAAAVKRNGWEQPEGAEQ